MGLFRCWIRMGNLWKILLCRGCRRSAACSSAKARAIISLFVIIVKTYIKLMWHWKTNVRKIKIEIINKKLNFYSIFFPFSLFSCLFFHYFLWAGRVLASWLWSILKDTCGRLRRIRPLRRLSYRNQCRISNCGLCWAEFRMLWSSGCRICEVGIPIFPKSYK